MADLATQGVAPNGPMPPPTPTQTSPAKEGRLAGLRVLVADDDLAVCHSVEEILRAEGCQVVAASSGTEARDHIEHDRFDLVLSDVVMPDIDGYDLFMFLRERRPETPVVLMTAFFYDRDHVLKRSKLAGLDGILYKKPVEPARLIDIVLERCGR
jgi:two-component system CheB/CheR fusion protein